MALSYFAEYVPEFKKFVQNDLENLKLGLEIETENIFPDQIDDIIYDPENRLVSCSDFLNIILYDIEGFRDPIYLRNQYNNPIRSQAIIQTYQTTFNSGFLYYGTNSLFVQRI